MIQLMQIYFQKGDFTIEGGEGSWILDLLINAFGAFLGVVGAIAIYRMQVKKQQTDKLRYVVILIKSTIDYAKAQAIFCGALVEKINAEPLKPQIMQIQANSDLKRLSDKLDQESFYHSYLAKYQRKEETYQSFKKMYSYIDFIDMLFDQLKDFLQKENILIVEKVKNYVAHFEEGMDKAALLTVNENFQEDQLLNTFLNNSLVTYHNTPHDDTDYSYPYFSFVDPVLKFLVHNYPTNLECNVIVMSLKKAKAEYLDVIRKSEELVANIIPYQEKLNASADKLQKETMLLFKDYSYTKAT